MMHFLDTDTMTHAHLGHRKVASRIEQVGEQNVATTIITAIEIIRGRHDYILKAADGAQLLRAQQLFNASEVAPSMRASGCPNLILFGPAF